MASLHGPTQSIEVDRMGGLAFEQYVAQLLRHRGYRTIVTRASGDLGVDIVAQQGETRYAIQAKRYTGMVSRRAVSDAVGALAYYRCTGAMVITNSYFTPDAIKLARVNGCILVDRDTLRRWIQDYQGAVSRAAAAPRPSHSVEGWKWLIGAVVAFIVLSIFGAGLGGSSNSSVRGSSGPAATRAPGPAGSVSAAQQATAVAHLGAAVSWRQDGGDLGLALEEARQALGVWPGNAEAQSFQATVAPEAMKEARAQSTALAAASRTAVAEATAVQRAVVAQATAAQSTAMARVAAATAQVRAAANARATAAAAAERTTVAAGRTATAQAREATAAARSASVQGTQTALNATMTAIRARPTLTPVRIRR